MPELPEVETIRAGLARTVLGARIVDVEVLRDRSIRRQDGGAGAFAEAVTGRWITAAVRRGKFLWLPLISESSRHSAEPVLRSPRRSAVQNPSADAFAQPTDSLGHSPESAPVNFRHSAADEVGAQNPSQSISAATSTALLAHLGMSGQLLVRTSGFEAEPHPHLRVRFHLSDSPNGAQYLDFVDQRTFGHLLVDDLVPTADGAPGGFGSELARVPTSAAHIARDLLDAAFDLDQTVDAIRRRRTGIKRALLDQIVVSGIGNIYADEALWRSGVHFARATDRMRPIDLARLLEAAADVMTESLAQGGTSFDALYVDVAGESGYFSRALAVYGREGQPCPRCETPIQRESFMNRSAHYCPKCQPKPRGGNARF